MHDAIIAAKNPSKYMHEIEMHFNIRGITDSTNYYLGNELLQVGNKINVTPKKYVNEILCNYKRTHSDLKKEVPPMMVKEHPELYDSTLLNEKYHKSFQHNIGVCQWMIVAGKFDLAYAVSSLSRFLDAPWVGHLEMSRGIFGYLKMYLKRGYSINPQPMTINDHYEKVQMKYYFVNQYEYFNE